MQDIVGKNPYKILQKKIKVIVIFFSHKSVIENFN